MNPQNESVLQDIVWSIRRLVRAVDLDSQKISKRYGLTEPQSAVLRTGAYVLQSFEARPDHCSACISQRAFTGYQRGCH